MVESSGVRRQVAGATRSPRVLAVAAALLVSAVGCTGAPLSDPVRNDAPGSALGEDADPLAEGLAAQAEERYDDAVAAYERALADDPDNHLALYNLGQLEQSRGDAAAAEDYYRQALDVEPAYVPALLNLAIIRTAEEDHEEAADLYEQVIDIDEDHAGAWLLLGYALLAQDDEEAAQEAFDQAVDLDPDLEDRLPD